MPNDSNDPGLPPGLATRYEVERLLGEGGMGLVWLANDRELPRKVAIKAIREELSMEPDIRKRIERECQYHAQIGTHPHIVSLFDKVEEEGKINLIMEYVPGETLADLCADYNDKGEPLPIHTALSVVLQTAEALKQIHDNGIVHRDIKPDNVLVYPYQDRYWAKLMDFGIARLTEEAEAQTMLTHAGTGGPGTPTYMAPEQIDSATFGEIGPATDIYAMGAMLYRVVAGQQPYSGTLTEVYTSHLTKEPPQLESGGELDDSINEIIRTAMAKQPADRYRDAGELIQTLAAVAKALESGDPQRTLPAASRAPASSDQSTARTVIATSPPSGDTTTDRTQIHTGAGQPAKRRILWPAAAAVLVIGLAAGSASFVWEGPVEQTGPTASKGDPGAEPDNGSGAEPVAKQETPDTPTGPTAPGQQQQNSVTGMSSGPAPVDGAPGLPKTPTGGSTSTSPADLSDLKPEPGGDSSASSVSAPGDNSAQQGSAAQALMSKRSSMPRDDGGDNAASTPATAKQNGSALDALRKTRSTSPGIAHSGNDPVPNNSSSNDPASKNSSGTTTKSADLGSGTQSKPQEPTKQTSSDQSSGGWDVISQETRKVD